MDLLGLYAKISLDDTEFQDRMEQVAKTSKNVKAAVDALQSPFDRLEKGINAVAHPIETAKNAFEGLKEKTEAIRHPIEALKNKWDEASSSVQRQRDMLQSLASRYEAAKETVAQLTREYDQSVKETGKTSEKSRELADKLASAQGSALNAKDALERYAVSVADTGKESQKSSEKAAAFAEALGNGIAKAGQMAESALSAASAAVKTMTKLAIDQYGDYEQLVGGVETLFKDSAGKVQQYANEAYQTAGLSANQYMEAVTGFSASLLQSLDGDTARAADLADQAIRDMSDNANKMGTDMASIQNAYQGFAKQNYTMLDNLKLGYGGTKEEMQRLLEDAEKLSGQKFDLSSYADIVEAIHVVQTEMGITGTTAAEAASTIQGSVGAMKFAWLNFITGLGNENADLGGLLDSLVESFQTAASNLVPRLVQILSGLGQAIAQAAPVLASEAASLIGQALPPMLNAGAQLLTALVDGLVGALPELLAAVPGVIEAFADALGASLPQLAEAGSKLLEMLQTGISQGIPRLLAALPDMMVGFLNGFQDGIGGIADLGAQLLGSLADGILGAIPELVARLPEVISAFVDSVVSAADTVLETGATLLLSLLNGIVETIPELTARLPEVIDGIVGAITEGLPELVNAGIQVLSSLIEGILDAIPELATSIPELISTIVETLSENFPQIVRTGMDILLSLVDGVIDNLPNLISMALEMIVRFVAALVDNLPKILGAGADILLELLAGIQGAIPDLVDRIPDVLEAIVLGFLDGVDRLRGVGKQLLEGLGNGINDALAWLEKKILGVVDRIKGWFTGKKGFDEHSPSRWAHEVGALVTEGLANGMDEKADKVQQKAEKIAQNTYSTLKTWADRQTKMLSLSYQDQIELWEEIQKQFKQGSQQFLDAEEKIFDLRQKRDKEYAEQQKKRQQEFEKLLKERESALKEYQGKAEKIQKEMDSAQEEYQKALESRTQQIFNSYGLFDELPEKQKVTGDQLLQNLNSQVVQMEQFYTGLEKLAERGAGMDLVEEIRQMGPKAKDQLDALLNMSDGKLEQYARLYGEKQKLASDTATEELAGFLRETEEKIAEGNRQLKQLNDEYGPKIGLSLMDGMVLGVKQGAGGLQQALIQQTQSAYNEAMRNLDQLAGGMGGGYQKSIGSLRTGIMGQDLLKPGALNYGNIDFGQSAAGLSSAALVNTLAGGAAQATDASLTVNLMMDGKKMASALLDPLAKFAKGNGTPIVNPTGV